MPLKFGDEQVTPYLKFNAKEKTWAVNDEDGEIVEIKPPRLLMDLENIQTGWFRFREAEAPNIVLDPPGTEAEEPEGGNHKRGFRLNVHSGEHGTREMASNSLMFKRAVQTLYNSEFEPQKAANVGKIPLVEVTGHTAHQGHYGTNYRPEFRIVGWYPRPKEFEAVQIKNAARAPTMESTAAAAQAPQSNNAMRAPATEITPEAAQAPLAAPKTAAAELNDEIPW
jgi:hypothetical protein